MIGGGARVTLAAEPAAEATPGSEACPLPCPGTRHAVGSERGALL